MSQLSAEDSCVIDRSTERPTNTYNVTVIILFPSFISCEMRPPIVDCAYTGFDYFQALAVNKMQYISNISNIQRTLCFLLPLFLSSYLYALSKINDCHLNGVTSEFKSRIETLILLSEEKIPLRKNEDIELIVLDKDCSSSLDSLDAVHTQDKKIIVNILTGSAEMPTELERYPGYLIVDVASEHLTNICVSKFDHLQGDDESLPHSGIHLNVLHSGQSYDIYLLMDSNNGKPVSTDLPDVLVVKNSALRDLYDLDDTVFYLEDYLGSNDVLERKSRQASSESNSTPLSEFGSGPPIDRATNGHGYILAIGSIIYSGALELSWLFSSLNFDIVELPHEEAFRIYLYILRGGSYILSGGLIFLQDLLIRGIYKLKKGSPAEFGFIRIPGL